MLAIRWAVLWSFFAMSGIIFWSILFFGGILSIIICIRRILEDKQYLEYMSAKAEEKLKELTPDKVHYSGLGSSMNCRLYKERGE